MKVVLLLAIVASILIPSFLPGLKAKELLDPDSGQFTQTLYQDILKELIGAHLRIAATHIPPTMIIEKNSDGTYRYSGFSVDVCQYLSEVFKFTYSFVNTMEDEVKQLGANEAEGKLLIRKEADITTTDTSLHLGLYNRFDISIPLFISGSSLMVPWPDEESRLLAPIYPFQPTVWLVFFVVLLSMTLIFTLLPWIHEKIIAKIGNMNNTNQQYITFSFNELSNQALAIAANITGHSGFWPGIIHKQLFYRIVLGSWCLAILVLVNAYSSLLISFLTIPTLKPVAKSFDDVSFRNVQALAPLVAKNSIASNIISGANQSSALNKWQKRGLVFVKFFREHPDSLYATNQQRFDKMFTGKYAYATNEMMAYTFLNELNKKAGYCRFTLSVKHLDDLIEYSHVFLLRKHWRYTDAMRNKMQWWADTGLAMHWIKRNLPSDKGCLFEDYKKNSPAVRILTLKDLSGAFVILLMGCALSLFVFLIEKIHYYRKMLHHSV